jgi:hypothetical protein
VAAFSQTKDPIIAVLLVHQEDHQKILVDHEARIRPLEHLRAQLLILATLGAAVGAAIVNYLFQR